MAGCWMLRPRTVKAAVKSAAIRFSLLSLPFRPWKVAQHSAELRRKLFRNQGSDIRRFHKAIFHLQNMADTVGTGGIAKKGIAVIAGNHSGSFRS